MYFSRGIAAVLSAAACWAFAAERAVTVGEPVIVTATRFEDRYLDKPVNVTIITAEDIQNSTARTVPDLLSEKAGIAIHDFFGNNAATTTVDLRGFGITGAQNTLILVDGRRFGDIDLSGMQWSAIPLAAIERIEIVRGSGAVLYGDGATAGVINIITRSPANIGNTAVVQGRAGSYETFEGQLYANYFTRNLGINLIASNFESDGYRNNNRNRQSNLQGELRLLTERGDVSFKVANDNQGIRLPGARQVQPSAGVNQLETDRRGATTPLDYAQRIGNRATFDWRHETSVGQFNLGIGYRDKEQTSYFDQDGFPDYRVANLNVWSFSPRMKFAQPLFSLANTLVAGLDWYSWDYRLRVSNSTVNITQPINTVKATQENAAFYLHNTTQISPRFTLVAGARSERFKIDANDFFDPTAPGGAFGSGAPAGSQKDTEHAYELALRYQIASEWAAIGRAGRNYRFANVDEIYEFGGPPLFSREFQFLRPQTARSYEAGIERRSARGLVRATLFAIDVTDEIHLDVFSTGIGNTNLPPSRRRGLELEAQQSFGGSLRLSGSYTLTDAEFREGVLPGSAFTQQNVVVAGKTVPLVPRHKLNLNASWAITARTRLNALVTYVGEQFMDNDEANTLGTKIPAYTVADLKLVHQEGAWRFTAAVNNLLNEKYYNYAVRSQFVPDRYNAYPLPERSFTMTLEYAFR
ncbi:MAG: TonB-dependent receptor [Betaproteobacteria bacterium]|nr:TonB-dependent receptor [Betaproteobacteria bacterium]